MAQPDRLSPLDKALLDAESSGPSHMHVALVMLFRGRAPSYDSLARLVEQRLHLVPRYRQRLAFVPCEQGRPVWVDDTHFNLYYHLRMTALPEPADEGALEELAGEIFSQRLHRTRPLWELWLVEKVSGGRFALIAKAHHVLVDGQGGVDLTTVLLDRSAADGTVPPPPSPYNARPEPGPVKLVGEAWLERLTKPRELVRRPARLRELSLEAAGRALQEAVESGSFLVAGLRSPAPPSPLNVRIGPHRRCHFFVLALSQLRSIRDRLGGTVNDVILSGISLGLGHYLREHGLETKGLTLKALVPVSRRLPEAGRGGELSSMRVDLPVDLRDPSEVHRLISTATKREARRAQAVSAHTLTSLAGFAQSTILSQAARLQVGQRYANLVVTNVPGPQMPLYLLGKELLAAHPILPLPRDHALGIALMSYNGAACFGLVADYDALPDLERVAELIGEGLDELAQAAGVTRRGGRRRRAAAGGR